MSLKRRIPIKRSVPILLIGFAIFLIYLHYSVGIPKIIATIQKVDLIFYSLAVIALLADMLFYALAWHYFLRPLSVKAPFRKTFLYTSIGIFADLLVPAESISGDVSRAYLMTKGSGENSGKVAASVISHRILTTIITLLSLIIGSISFVILKYTLPTFIFNLILIVSLGSAFSLLLLFLLCLREHIAQKVIDSILNFLKFISRGRLKTASLRSNTQKALKVFRQSIELLGKNPISLIPPVVFSLAAWFLSVLVSFFVFVSLNQPVPFTVIIIVYSISCALQAIPLGIPAEVGVIEFVMTILYSNPLFGEVPIEFSGAATILIRVLTVWLRMFIGFAAVQWIGIKTLIASSD